MDEDVLSYWREERLMRQERRAALRDAAEGRRDAVERAARTGGMVLRCAHPGVWELLRGGRCVLQFWPGAAKWYEPQTKAKRHDATADDLLDYMVAKLGCRR